MRKLREFEQKRFLCRLRALPCIGNKIWKSCVVVIVVKSRTRKSVLVLSQNFFKSMIISKKFEENYTKTFLCMHLNLNGTKAEPKLFTGGQKVYCLAGVAILY